MHRQRLAPVTTIRRAGAALAADEALVPVIDGRLGAVVLGHLGRVGLGAIPAIETPDEKAHLGSGGVAERHRRAAVRFQRALVISRICLMTAGEYGSSRFST